ncbi:MAG: hypothetical protein MJE77_38385 [Proteobacteria bacterium]|nr:hypothetical protein [Pseudomonadota bacterium]
MNATGNGPAVHRLGSALLGALILFTMPPACDCQQGDRRTDPVEQFLGSVPGVPAPHRGESLTDRDRQQVASLNTILARYYPSWKREVETLDEYVQRHGDSRETRRLKTLIDERLKDAAAWRRFLDDVKRILPADVLVRDGRPPFGVIPSYQIAVQAAHTRGSVAIVFRVSFLAPVYDYYENVRDHRHLLLETRLAPSAETAALADQVRRIIAEHYSDYRELPAALGATLVPNLGTGNLPPNEATLADMLFEDSRSW